MSYEVKHRYEDIILRPRFSTCRSRKDLSPSVRLGKNRFNLPVVPANMKSVVNERLCHQLAFDGYFYIMHRFGDTESFVKNFSSNLPLSISVGVKQEDRDLLRKIRTPEYITIDIAHGYCQAMKEMIGFIHDKCPNAFIIAGNVATAEAVNALQVWGANAVKVGIAQGGACFLADTEVKTKSGYKKIQDVLIGDEVLTHDGCYNEVYNTSKMSHNGDFYEVNGQKCTPDHLFYVVKKEDVSKLTENNISEFAIWKEARDLNENYFVINIQEQP